MILTGAFLAEQAATIDNKLNVAGGVLSKFTVGPDRSASFVLVVLTRADPENSDDRRVEVELIPPTGEAPVLRRFEVPEASIGEFPGFAFFGIDANLPVDGRWVLVVTGGSEAITLPLLVDTWTPPQSLGI
ncbi:hypothetical protein [Mycobacterium conspicuum]|uniref:Uncharacterized protein n=1 Tax=Mycobacterium conspicuum TaxID=44010 RepID=A0A1X1SWA2_9MYCO|nr:hypothetical protein [Mycobacterium conspicuum]ORV35146.1 hypothetical protein AWC00_01035 [Mycobacterium conspicuum]BBZ42097.1 hypothetical protein MCNS_51600 [Mycobacterium conspicuum]